MTPTDSAEKVVAELREPVHTEALMQRWDEWRRKHKAGFGGSATRDEFESIIDEIDEKRSEAAALIESLRATIERQAEAERAFLAQLGDVEVAGWESAARKLKAVLDAAEDNERAAEARVTALEAVLRKFLDFADAEYVPNTLFDRARQALSRSSTEVKNDER